MAEIEPFKTAIILKFLRDWPFVVFAAGPAAWGSGFSSNGSTVVTFVRWAERIGDPGAYAHVRLAASRYQGCAVAPATPVRTNAPFNAIHPTGEINPNECVNCLHCQVLYQSEAKCPVK